MTDPAYMGATTAVRLAGRLIASWAAAVALCIVLGSFSELGLLVFGLTALASLPFLCTAVVVSLVLQEAIIRRPACWSAAAVVTSLAATAAFVGRAALLGAFIAVPAAIAFAIWMRLRPLDAAST